MKANKIALGVLGGIATGVALGILFAPAKGVETRKKIQQKSNDLADEFNDKFSTITEEIKNNYGKLFQNGKELVAEGKSKVEEVKNEFKSGNA